jgi:hypothetical protein
MGGKHSLPAPPDFTFVNKDGVVCRMFPDPQGSPPTTPPPDDEKDNFFTPLEETPKTPYFSAEEKRSRAAVRKERRKALESERLVLEGQKVLIMGKRGEYSPFGSGLNLANVVKKLANIMEEERKLDQDEKDDLKGYPPHMRLPPAGPPAAGSSFHFVF